MKIAAVISVGLLLAGCRRAPEVKKENVTQSLLSKYASFRLEIDPAGLTDKERQMTPLLIDAARIMDELFWQQAYGDKRLLLDKIQDPEIRRFAEINYGPWDRLDGNRPFVPGYGSKPLGANFYPADMTREQFESAASVSREAARQLKSQYTLVIRPEGGGLVPVPYHKAFAGQLKIAAEKLREAAKLAEDPGLRKYLQLRAQALLTDDYQASDLAWLDMKKNKLDIVIGPIETYEDRLFGYKAAYEAYVLVKDLEWSRRLAHYVRLLPSLQMGLPVPPEYKREKPGAESDIYVYDALYFAGDCNAGSKTIAINLPNDEEIQLRKGARRLQLRNVMRAKFEKILLPLAQEVIAADQQARVNFDAFFANTLFHEVAHGLGIKKILSGRQTVREALKELASTIEESKADILGLYLITKLHENETYRDTDLLDNYVTFLAGIFRSVRFGTASAHGTANLIHFNYFEKAGAFRRDENGRYRVDQVKMQLAIISLVNRILRLQGDGDYAAAATFVKEAGVLSTMLKADLERLSRLNIPVDIVFEQGKPF